MAATDHLNPGQHGKYQLVRTKSPDHTNYGLRYGHQQVGNLMVTHHKQHTGIPIYPTDPEKRVGKYDTATRYPEEASWKGHDDLWASQAAVEAGVGGSGDVQIPLFRQPITRQRNEVFMLSMSKQHRAMVGTMLGVAGRDAVANTGIGLAPSNNLSEHSMQMVKGLAQRGVVSRHQVPSEVRNDTTWSEPWDMSDLPPPEPANIVPREEMEAGRKAFRSTIRPPKPVPDPNQGRLF
jgi:hypothetical protein